MNTIRSISITPARGSSLSPRSVRTSTCCGEHILGNPHSASLSSSASTALVEGARRSVLAYFNAADDYTAIFTLNATAALKLVGESYAFAPGADAC